MQELISYLRENVILDFQGDLDAEKVREFLKPDTSREARALMTKLSNDGGVDDMMLVLADCLVETVRKSLSDTVIRNNLSSYAEA